DVVPRNSLATDRYLHLSVGPKGRVARLDNALQAAPAFGLQRREAADRIEDIYGVVRTWRTVFEDLAVSSTQRDRVANAFRRGDDIGLAAIRAARRR
ncbi:MAG: type II toxin-antitoxin system HipA family toxin, partial [Burkholderiales bacterium]